jgi:hypothetical protein
MTIMCGFFDRFRKKKTEDAGRKEIVPPPEEDDGAPMAPPPWLRVLTGLRTKDRDLFYVVKLENRGDSVMGESTITIGVPDKLFEQSGLVRKSPHLDPGDVHKESIHLLPTFRPGGGMVGGQVTYFDFDMKGEMTFALPEEKVNFFVPPLEPVRTDTDGWRLKTAALRRYEIETEEVPAPPEQLFEVVLESLEGLDLFAVDPIITPGVYRGVAQYIGLAGDDLYGFEVQVIGRGEIARLLITALGPDDIAARAMGFRVIEAISARTRIRECLLRPEPQPTGEAVAEGEAQMEADEPGEPGA